MLTFAQSQASKGKLAIDSIEVPMHESEPLRFGVRALSGDEELAALSYARTRAKTAGIENPTEDDPVYSRFLMAATLARASVAGTPGKDGALSFPKTVAELVPFFASPEEILASDVMGRDRIAYAYERWEIWQEQVSPSTNTLKIEDVLERAREMAGDSTPRPFLTLRPGMRWIFTRSLAVTLLNLLNSKSPFGGSDASAPASSSSGGKKTSSDAAEGSKP